MDFEKALSLAFAIVFCLVLLVLFIIDTYECILERHQYHDEQLPMYTPPPQYPQQDPPEYSSD